MIRIILITILLFLSITLLGQNDQPEFGKPSLAELMMKDCDFEKNVSAMKLLKYEKIELVSDNDMTIRTENRERVKIFSQNGYAYADIEIPYGKKNKIKNLSAYIYNLDEDGKVSVEKIDKDDIFKKSEKKKKKGSLVFTFPNIKPGSVIEYQYTEVEHEAYYNDIKFFQAEIPVQLCVYKMICPNHMKPELVFPGTYENLESKFEEHSPSQYRNTQIITGKNIYSFREEPMMSSAKDNLQYMTVKFIYRIGQRDTLINKTAARNNLLWNTVGTNLMFHPLFGMQIKKTIPGTTSLIDSAKKMKDVAQKVDFIYKHVRNRVSWNDESYIYAEDLEKAWNKGSGSNAEINLILLNLFRKSGIDCYPILVRSREYGKANRQLFTLSQFNNVNVLVLNLDSFYVLDATKKYLSYKTPPYEILNRDVLLADTFRSKWITIVDTRPFVKQVITVKAVANSVGQIAGEAFIEFYDYLKEFELVEKEEKSNAVQEKDFFNKSPTDIKIDSIVEDNPVDELQPLTHRVYFTYTPDSTDDFIFIDPFFLSSLRKNPFIDSIRRTDIDFGSNQYYSIYLHLTLPDNFIIEDIPKNTIFIADDSSLIFKRQTLQSKNVIVFKHSFEIKRSMYSKDEYLALHDYFRKIYGAVKEQLLVKKK